MYPTALVRQLVLHFAELAGWEGNHYLVTQSRRTFDRAANLAGVPGVAADEYGDTIVVPGPEPYPNPVTWISPDIRSARLLTRICAHEALHAARPAMRHGRAFNHAIAQLLRGDEL